MKNALTTQQLGQRIKEIRKKKNFTLDTLAQLSGVSKGYLSHIENGQNDPTYSILLKIARAFSITTSHLLGEEDSTTSYLITRVADHKMFISKNETGDYRYWNLSGNIPNKKMDTQLIEMPLSDATVYRSDDERFFYVVSGKIKFCTGDILEAGDAIYLMPNAPHGGVSVGEELAKVIFVTCK